MSLLLTILEHITVAGQETKNLNYSDFPTDLFRGFFYKSFTQFHANASFLYRRKRQKTYGLLMFSGGIEMENWRKMNQEELCPVPTQLTFTCSKSVIGTLEKGVKFVQS